MVAPKHPNVWVCIYPTMMTCDIIEAVCSAMRAGNVPPGDVIQYRREAYIDGAYRSALRWVAVSTEKSG
jgi:hypothetical protein